MICTYLGLLSDIIVTTHYAFHNLSSSFFFLEKAPSIALAGTIGSATSSALYSYPPFTTTTRADIDDDYPQSPIPALYRAHVPTPFPFLRRSNTHSHPPIFPFFAEVDST